MNMEMFNVDKHFFNEQLLIFVTKVKNEFNIKFEKKLLSYKENVMIRGTNPSTSHLVEEKFAEFLNELYLHKDYLYLIDVNFTIKLDGKNKSIRPDVVILDKRTKEIVAIFELKIDDARASDDWVKTSIEKLELLKKVSLNLNKKPNNSIHYNSIILHAGEPERTPKGRYKTQVNLVNCSFDAKIACITLCKENSRRKKLDKDEFRTTGDLAMYLSKRHFNNPSHSMESLVSSSNLNSEELYHLLEKMDL